MPLPRLAIGPADVIVYERTATTISAPSALQASNVTSAAEDPDVGVDGRTRLQGGTSYALSVVFFGAYEQGGLACTVPPANYTFALTSGHNAIRVNVTTPAGTLAIGILVNDALAAVAPTPLSVRNGASGTTQAVVYYEPSARAIGRSSITNMMTGVSVYTYARNQFAETSGDTTLTIAPEVVTVERNRGSNMPLVTGMNVSMNCNLLASGKADMARVLGGIATKTGGSALMTNPQAAFGFTGTSAPSSRPIELVGPGEVSGKEDSVLIFSALKQSTTETTKTWSKTNPSNMPVTFVSAEDDLLQGVHASFVYFQN